MTTSQERISSRKTFPVAFESIRYKNRKEKLEILPVSSRLGNFQCSPLAYWGQNLIGRKRHVNGVPPPLWNTHISGCWNLVFISSIMLCKGQTTNVVWWRFISILATITKSWKIKLFLKPVGNTARTSFRLVKKSLLGAARPSTAK